MFLVLMAEWSHQLAKLPVDPGFLEWETFRTPEMLADTDSKDNWKDPAYKKRMEANPPATIEDLD